MTFNWLRESLGFGPSEDTKTTRAEESPSEIHNEIFSNYSYANLSTPAQNEVKQFLEDFYAGCVLLNANEENLIATEEDLTAASEKIEIALKKVKKHNTIVLFNGCLYYAEFDKKQNKHVISPVQVPENEPIRVEARDALMNTIGLLEKAEPREATREELRQVRQVSDCMRFKTPAVVSIFDKRHSRKEALLNSDALLDSLIPDALAFYSTSQVAHLDESLRFAIIHYLAQAQAAEDYIGPIKSPHTEIAACYRKIKLCTVYQLQLKLRQLQLDLGALDSATAKEDKATRDHLLILCKQRYNDTELDISDDAYITILKSRQHSLSSQWNKYERLELLRLDIHRLKLVQKRSDNKAQKALEALFQRYTALKTFVDFTDDLQHKVASLLPAVVAQYDDLKADLDKINVAVESLKSDPLYSVLPSFLKEDEDEYDSDYLIGQLNKANGRRLFWVWTRCLIETVVIIAHEALLVSTMIAAWVSWSLYWFRGGVTAAAAAWHSYDSLVTERERAIASHKRAWAQWSARYDDILNDLIWGSANFACCFWLIGAGILGTIGDSLTLVLLGMDLLLSGLRWLFGKRAHRGMIAEYGEQITSLLEQLVVSIDNNSKIDASSTFLNLETNGQQPSEQTQDLSVKEIVQQLKMQYEVYDELEKQEPFILEVWAKHRRAIELIAVKEKIYDLHNTLSIKLNQSENPLVLPIQVLSLHWQTLFNDEQAYIDRWCSKWSKLDYDIVYAVALAVAFGLMCFCPVVGLSLFGAIFLSVSTVLWRTAYAKDDIIDEMGQTIRLGEQQYQEKLNAFIDLAHQYVVASADVKEQIESKMKQLYLQMRTLGAKSGYDQGLRRFKIADFSRETAMRILVPIAIALTLLFAPATIATIPTYVFLMLGVLVTAVLVSVIIHRYLKPKASSWEKENGLQSSTACFDEKEYAAFKDKVLVSKEEDLASSEKNPLLTDAKISDQNTFDVEKGQRNGQFFFCAMKKHRVENNQSLMQETAAIALSAA